MAITRAFRIRGKVQGVYFRHSARLEAQRLSLRGWACNLDDGSVEVRAHGAPEAVEALRRWLNHGPSQARVDEVVELPLDEADSPPSDFTVK
jgi:acylphosphatase